MKVKVVLDRKAIQKLSKAQAVAVSQTASQMLAEVRNAGTMPFDVGSLENEGSFVDDTKVGSGEVSIVHDTPYAKRLYYNPQYNFQRGKNPLAGAGWWDDWISGSKQKRPAELYAQLYRRASGGYVK